jgi:hypothetical protein
MIISKVIDFRSFYKNLLKIQKFDRGACLGIVYESILPFQQFLIGLNFLVPVIVMSLELTLICRLREKGGPPCTHSSHWAAADAQKPVTAGGRDPPSLGPSTQAGSCARRAAYL